MVERITSMKPREQVTLRLYFGEPADNESYTAEATFMKVEGSGNTLRAHFILDGVLLVAYRLDGYWVYGKPAKKLLAI